MVLPYMASLVAKKKGNQLYYYLVESARVDGHPRIVHQAYLGSAEKVAALVKDRTSNRPCVGRIARVRFARRPLVGGPEVRRLGRTGGAVAGSPLGRFPRPLRIIGGHQIG